MKDLVGMIPGASKAMKDVEIEDDAFKHYIIHSMTPSERSKPSLIDVKRKARISKVQEQKMQVNQLMKQFEQMSKMINDARTRRKKPHEDDGWNERNARRRRMR
jgi:signal recognition particle subunit SRP54